MGIGELTVEEMPEAKLLIFFIVYICVDGEREIKELKKKSLACLLIKYQRINNLTFQQERHCMVPHICTHVSICRDKVPLDVFC